MGTESPKSSIEIWQRVAAATALILAVTEVLVDWLTGVDLNLAIVYGVPLVVVAAARSRSLLWGLWLFLFVTTFAVYFAQIPAGSFSFVKPLFVNRVLCGLALVLTVSLLHFGLVAADLLDAQRRSLEKQNAELERRRQQAEELGDRKSRFLASASHDIRTPVHVIKLAAELLCNPLSAQDLPEVVHLLQANATALTDLVTDVLDIARFDALQAELRTSEFSLNALLAEECGRILPVAQEKNLALKVEVPKEPVCLRTDRVKLIRIISNLVGNAIKYTDAGGVTVVASVADNGTATIAVGDTGVGIARDKLPLLFDEFFQLSNPERDGSKGYGLGLAICKRLADVLGVKISVESQVGCGSTFTLSLPASCVLASPSVSGTCEGCEIPPAP